MTKTPTRGPRKGPGKCSAGGRAGRPAGAAAKRAPPAAKPAAKPASRRAAQSASKRAAKRPKKAPACPVCGGAAAVTDHLSAARLRAGIAEACGAAPPDRVKIRAYDLCACAECGLVFADPMVGGSAALYEWLGTLEHRQTRMRWEWREIRRRLARRSGAVALLDVGCGTGRFLSYLADLAGLAAIGIDHSREAIQQARAQGHNVYRCDIDSVRAHIGRDTSFDAITLSHVLEHVEDPKATLLRVAELLRPGGAIYVSIPYSPMSRERQGYDPMNLPPHHLTRWNMRALRRIAAETGLDMDYVLAKPKSPLKRALKQTCEKKLGAGARLTLWRRIAVNLTNPRLFLETYRENADRERVDGRLAPDSILVIFRRATD